MFSEGCESALVRQKDYILSLINGGEYDLDYSDTYLVIARLLAFCREFWEAVGYGYKWVELEQRVREKIFDEINLSSHWTQRKKWVETLGKFNSIVGGCK